MVSDPDKCDHGKMPRGICPACLNSVSLKKANIARGFNCPHCGELVRGPRAYRVLLNLVFYVGPTAVLCLSHASALLFVLAWVPLAYALAIFYITLVEGIFVIPLERYSGRPPKDGFQTLGLGK
jgi:hypothetical protein